MSDTDIVHIALQTMLIAAKLSAPILLTSLAIGLGISLFQSVTQIQEVTLTFVPKIVGVGVVILVCGNWMLSSMVEFTTALFAQLPQLLGHG